MAIETLDVTPEHKQYLAARDPVMADLIARYPLEALPLRTEFFASLAHAVVGQQISIYAARAIYARLEAAAGGSLTAEAVLDLGHPALVAAGLSQRKAEYILDLAAQVDNRKLDLGGLAGQADDAVVTALTAVKGIGEWTAQMFLIFSLGRPNVLATKDVGLQRAMMRRYQIERDALPPSFAEFRQRWSPYCTVASLYLWEALDEH